MVNFKIGQVVLLTKTSNIKYRGVEGTIMNGPFMTNGVERWHVNLALGGDGDFIKSVPTMCLQKLPSASIVSTWSAGPWTPKALRED